MGTDTSSALDQPSMAVASPIPARDKVMRIATMTTQLLDEIRNQPLDTASLNRLRAIDTHIIDQLLADLAPDLHQELQRLALPLTRHTLLSDTELRLAHAQLVGWLQGLVQTAQTDLSQTATDLSPSGDVPTAPSRLDRPHSEPCNPTNRLPNQIDTKAENAAIRSARQTLITAITKRITQQRLAAAQAAAVLNLTGPRVTKLLQASVDEFTVEELLNLLPALELTIQVGPVANTVDEAR
jgi:predicted XRE-type DNA-binding protein